MNNILGREQIVVYGGDWIDCCLPVVVWLAFLCVIHTHSTKPGFEQLGIKTTTFPSTSSNSLIIAFFITETCCCMNISLFRNFSPTMYKMTMTANKPQSQLYFWNRHRIETTTLKTCKSFWDVLVPKDNLIHELLDQHQLLPNTMSLANAGGRAWLSWICHYLV